MQRFMNTFCLSMALCGAMLFFPGRESGIAGEATARSLANSPWPKFRGDAKNTGRSSYAGPQTNAKKWAFTTGAAIESSPAIAPDGTIYVGSNDGKLYAVNPDGTKKWEFATGDDVTSSPAIANDGTIYVGSEDYKVYAIHPNGSKRWEYATGGKVVSSPAIAPDGTIYVCSWDDVLHALNPDGTKKWDLDVFAMDSSPAIAPDGTVYVGGTGGLWAVHPDGSEKWHNSNVSWMPASPVIGPDGTVYVGTFRDDGESFFAYDPADGSWKWGFDIDGIDEDHWINSSAALAPDGTIYVGSWRHRLHALNPDGTEKWAFWTPGLVDASPVIGANGTIYVGCYGRFYAVNPDGSTQWEYDMPGDVNSSAAIAPDGTVYVGCGDGKLYAFGSTNGAPVISSGPTAAPNPAAVGGSVSLSVSASDPDGDSLSYSWDFGDGASGTGCSTSHTYSSAGTYNVSVTVADGNGGTAVGSVSVTVSSTGTDPTQLPFQMGALTIDGDNVEALGDGRHKVSGNVTINGALAMDQPITCDVNTNQVTLNASVQLLGGDADYASLFSTEAAVTIDADTGMISGLGNVRAGVKVAGLEIEFTNLTIRGEGIEFDFKLALPNVTKASKGQDLVKVELTQFRIDGQAPFLHVLGTAEFELNDVYLVGTKFGFERIFLSLNPSEKRFAGEVVLTLPGGGAVGGSAEIIDGKLNAIFFQWSGDVPLWTFTGGDALVLTDLSGGFDHLNDPEPFTLMAGKLDPETFFVQQAGVGLGWTIGPVRAIEIEGAASWNTRWDLALGGNLKIFSDRFKMADVSCNYRSGKKIITVRGKLGLDDLFSLQGALSGCFEENNRHFHAAAGGEIGMPEKHWAKMLVNSVSCQVAFLGRIEPVEKYLAGARGAADIMGIPRSVAFQYDMQTGKLDDTLDLELLKALDSVGSRSARAAQVHTFDLADDKGLNGLVVRLQHETGDGVFNLRRPDGTLITPESASGVNVAYAHNPAVPESVYVVNSAANGTWKVEFDDSDLGAWTVRSFTPLPPPEVMVTSPETATAYFDNETPSVGYQLGNVRGPATVRVYLDADQDWGGGHLASSSSSLDSAKQTLNLSKVPPGEYFLGVEADPESSLPVFGYGNAKITVKATSGTDTDGDGFPDELELELGSDPDDEDDTPWGISGEGQSLSLSKMLVKLNFARGSSDMVRLQGSLPVPEGFSASGKAIAVSVGGMIKKFTLNSKGVSKTTRDLFRLRVKKKRKKVIAQQAKFILRCRKGNFDTMLQDEGLVNSTVTKASRQLKVMVLFDGEKHEAVRTVSYTCKPGKKGIGK